MDPKDKEIADLKAKVTELTTTVQTANKEVVTLKESNTKLGEDIKKKDGVIDQKNRDLIGARKQYTEMSKRTKEELDAMTDAERESLERAEKLEKDAQEREKKDEEFRQGQIKSQRSQIFKSITGKRADLIPKLEENFNRIVGADKAATKEEIEKFANDAYNMLGTIKVDPIRSATNDGGGEPGNEGGEKTFADTDEGKGLAKVLGIPVEEPKK